MTVEQATVTGTRKAITLVRLIIALLITTELVISAKLIMSL